MKNNKITTIIVIIATILLAGVAIYTAIRLYQLRAKPVAPNVPESKPAAAGTTCGGIQGVTCPTGEVCIYSNGTTHAPSADATGVCNTATRDTSTIACQLSFAIATPSPSPSPTPVPGYPSCISKKVYFASNTTNNQDFTHGIEISSNTIVKRGDTLIFTISVNEVNGGFQYVTSDTLGSKLTFISYKSTDYCSFNSSTQTLSCTGNDTGRTGVKIEIKASVKTDATVGQIVNIATIKASTNTSTCNASFNITTPSPSPTPTKSPSPSPSPNPLCNSTCTTNAQCPSGLGCYIPAGFTSGNCRNMSCTSVVSCSCPTPSPSPSPTPTKSPSPSPTPTHSPSPSPTASPTPSPVPQCNTSCTASSQCPSGLSCYISSGASTGNCRNASCTSQTNCVCPTTTPTITPAPTSTNIAYVPTATPAPQPTLPESGTDWPTILGAVFGIFVIVGSVLLAF